VNLSLLRIFRFQKRAIRLVLLRGRRSEVNLTMWLCPPGTLSAFHATEKQRHHQEALAIGVEDRIA
jgi:hypothetical protein